MERPSSINIPLDEKLTFHRSGILGKLLIKKECDTNSIELTKTTTELQLPSRDCDVSVSVNVTVPVPRKRHATESAMLRGGTGQHIHDTQTTGDQRTEDKSSPSSSPYTSNDDKKKQINITKVVDKFLLEFMQAISKNGEDGSYTIPNTLEDRSKLHVDSKLDITNVPVTDSQWHNTSVPNQNVSPVNNECTTKSAEFGDQSRDFEERSSVSNKKSRPSYRPSRPPLLPPCRVCGDKASGYHYGVNTCEACKGFFRRSICKTGSYVCTGSGNCSTIGGKRTLCSYCRFKRCLDVGMSKDAIKTGRYTHELRSKNILEVKSLERLYGELDGTDNVLTDEMSRESDMLYAAFQTAYLKNNVLDVKLQSLIEGQKHLYEFLDDYYNDALMKQRQLAVYNGYINKTMGSKSSVHQSQGYHSHTNITSYQSSDTVHKHMEHSAYSNTSSDFSNQLNKPSTNNSYFNGHTGVSRPHINGHVGVSDMGEDQPPDESVKAEVMSKVITNMEQSVQGMLIFAKTLPRFDDLPKDDQASLLKAGRFDVWYIGHIRCFNVDLRVGACEWQFHANELAQVWGNDMINLAFSLSRVGQSLNLTKEETAALRAVCLTFPDRCMDLTERDEVEKIHQELLEVLQHVACKRMGANVYNRWFCKVIDFLMLLREFGIKFEKISSNIKLDWTVLKSNPLLLSVFLS